MKFAPWWFKFACGLGLVAATIVLPTLGALLAILGFLLTGIYLYGTWMAIKMLSSMVVNEAKTLPALTSFFVVLGFFMFQTRSSQNGLSTSNENI